MKSDVEGLGRGVGPAMRGVGQSMLDVRQSMRGLAFVLVVCGCWLAVSRAEARVGQHENRFRGDRGLGYTGWSELPSVTTRGRKVLVFGMQGAPADGRDMRATVDSHGYVTSLVIRFPRALTFSTPANHCEFGDLRYLLLYMVALDDEDETTALVFDDTRRPCNDPPAAPVTQLGQLLAGTRTSARMRLSKTEIRVRTVGRAPTALLEFTITYRGTPDVDVAAAALPPRPTARPDGAPMRQTPSRDELAEAGARISPDLSACVSAGAPRGNAMVALELDWTGDVVHVTLPSEWSTSRGAGCLETAFRKLEVPPFLETTYTVRYPITLR